MSERTIQGHKGFDTLPEALSTVRALTLPDIIDGRYRVLGRIGAGTMGIVLRAEDLFLQRAVAIKIVDPGTDAAVAERFVKEAQSLALVRHENVVQVYAFGRFQTASYLAMELVVGHSLESIIDAHAQNGMTIELSRAISILRSMAQGLDAVHARQLVHRDVKPANVIIEKITDRPVIIDFGLARRRSKSNPRLSITGGTPSYMAPEQAQDPNGTRVCAQTDVYALGCTAFEMLTGRPVFEGNDIFTVVLAHINEPPRKISNLRPDLAAIDDVLIRALAKEPADRFTSASDLMAAIEAQIGPASASRAPVVSAGPRVLVVAADAGFRRSLVRNTTSTLKAKGQEIALEEAETASQAVALVGGAAYDLVVIDEESAAGRTSELVTLLRAKRPNAEIVIVSRDLPATAASLGDQKVRHLVPKPINVHVLAAVLGRTTLGTGT